ncbi:MAG: hypothetical protein GON13_00425 [Nanoarchaeota archaeon]|nr:hypothetical protein [Nanoarchaeota archaeon]
MSVFERVSVILEDVVLDDSVPKNVRERINEAVLLLNKSFDDSDLLRDSVNEILDLVVQDTNLPLHTRTQIWNSVSILESAEN